MTVLPIDLDASPFGLLHPYLHRSYSVRRQFFVFPILTPGLFLSDDSNSLVTHNSSFTVSRPYRTFKYKMLSDKPSVAAFEAMTGLDPLYMP